MKTLTSIAFSCLLGFLIISNNNISAQNIVSVGTEKISQREMPCNGFFDYNWSAMIYQKSEINSVGYITKLSFEISKTASYQIKNQKIYISNIENPSFDNRLKPNSSEMTKVFEGSVQFNSNGWAEIILNTPFYFDNKSNLIIYYENMDGNWNKDYAFFNCSSTSENTSIHSESDHTFPTGKGSFTNLRPNVKFELANNSSVSNDLKFECYPNPTNSTVTVNHNLTSNSKIIVTNINGQIIFEKNISNSTSETIDLSGYSKGVYNIILKENNSQKTEKVILK